MTEKNLYETPSREDVEHAALTRHGEKCDSTEMTYYREYELGKASPTWTVFKCGKCNGAIRVLLED